MNAISSPCGHPPESLRVRANGVRDCIECKAERRRRARTAHPRLPLVFATPGAVEHALRLGVGVIENRVMRAIKAGDARYPDDDRAIVDLGDGVTAIAVRRDSFMTGRKGWLVVACHGRKQQIERRFE